MRAVRLSADGWRDIEWFDEVLGRVAASGHGELWFVTGNRCGLLDQVRARARDAPGCIAVGPSDGSAGGESGGLFHVAATAAGVVNPLGELALVLGVEVVRLLGKPKAGDAVDLADVFALFNQLVARAFEKAETVVFIVDAADRDEDLWNRRFTQ